MKTLKKAVLFFLGCTLVCGVLYTAVVTGLAQLLFPKQANGSIIEVDGKVYGSELLGQQFTDDAHLWGRIMELDPSCLCGRLQSVFSGSQKSEWNLKRY